MDLNNKRAIDAQTGVLGSLLISPELADEIFFRVRPEDYTDKTLRGFFEAAQQIWASGGKLDPVTLLNAVGRDYEPLIREILTLTPTAANWQVYCQLAKEEAKLEKLRKQANEILYAPNLEAAMTAVGGMEEISGDRETVRITSLSKGLEDFYTRQAYEQKPDYLDFGIRQLNEKLFVEQGDMVILGAFPSVGKTVLGFQLAYNIARKGKKVGMFSLETSDRKLYDRLTAAITTVDFSRIKRHAMEPEDYKAILDAMKEAKDVQLDVIAAAGMDVATIRSVAVSHRYDVIIVDYVQLVAGQGATRPEIVASISMGLHTLAQSAGITVIALSQLSRPEKCMKNKAPQMTSLRESGQLEQDADVVLLMSLTNEDDPQSDRRLDVAKNKEGERGRIFLRFDPQRMSFSPTTEKVPLPRGTKNKIYRDKEAEPPKLTEIDGQEELPFA